MNKPNDVSPVASFSPQDALGSQWLPTRSHAVRIALTYCVIGALWILCSGWVLHQLVHDEKIAAWVEQIKGWFYVSVTALLLGFWLERYFARIRHSAERLRESESRLHAVGDNLPDSYVYQYTRDEGGSPRFVYVSAGVERVHGVTPAAVQADVSCLFSQIDRANDPRFRKRKKKVRAT